MTPELLMSPSAGPEEIQLLQKLEEANRSVVVLGNILWSETKIKGYVRSQYLLFIKDETAKKINSTCFAFPEHLKLTGSHFSHSASNQIRPNIPASVVTPAKAQ